MALPDGTALSWRSFGRAMSVSWASRRVEEAAGRVDEPREDRVGQPAWPRRTSARRTSPVQREEAFGQEGVDPRGPRRRRAAVLPAPAEQSVGSPETLEEQLGGARGEPAVAARSLAVGPAPVASRATIASAKAAIARPFQRRQHLVVARRLRPRGAPLDQRPTGRREPVGDLGRRRPGHRGQLVVGADPAQDRPALPVARVGHVVGRRRRPPPRPVPARAGPRPRSRRTSPPSSPSVSASWLAANAAVVGPRARGPGSRACRVATSR